MIPLADREGSTRFSAGPGWRPLAGAGCLVVMILLTACSGYPISQGDRRSTSGQVGQLVVSEFRVLAPPDGRYAAGGVASADLSVTNRSGERDELVSASSPDAASVQLLKFGDQQAQAVIAGGGQTTEGILLQLADLRRAVGPGDSVSITLTFRNAGDLTLDVPVQRPGASASASSG